ncbi:MAG: HAMP domain-containing histidine kinase [Duncaniella sp.]|nr:HAMP domain-containing histidine kinase [Duncaniella sp.]
MSRLFRRHRLSYHWQLFLPIAVSLCVVFSFLIWYQYKREADYRSEILTEQLGLINKHVLRAYHDDISLRPFNQFISSYFRDSEFEGVRISVYNNETGMLRYSHGLAVPLDVEQENETLRTLHTADGELPVVQIEDDEKPFLVAEAVSDDGHIKVISAMPYNDAVDDAVEIDSTVWLIIGLCILSTLAITYWVTHRLTRSVTLLKEFAGQAATGASFEDLDKFPQNELGDISREIVALYREREKAVQLIKKERQVTIHAIEEKSRVMRQMTNNINHEIKTPVGIIRGYLESILSDETMDETTRRRFLERMLSNVERLSNLLNDVSTMTRLENGSDKIAVSRVDMHDLVYQIDYDLPATNIAGDLKFSFDIPVECYVSGNQGLLHGMICGLIKNAAMYSQGTQIGLNLISENDRFYVFAFWDDGVGVGEQHISHLFERFYRVDTGRSRKMGGTGLGLPIVKSTITSLGGTISVHNRSTGGLEFIFSLPKWHDRLA